MSFGVDITVLGLCPILWPLLFSRVFSEKLVVFFGKNQVIVEVLYKLYKVHYGVPCTYISSYVLTNEIAYYNGSSECKLTAIQFKLCTQHIVVYFIVAFRILSQ